MFSRTLTFLLFGALVFSKSAICSAIDLNPSNVNPMVADQDDDEGTPGVNGFAKPYDYERKSYGYDPEGIVYHENQPEDFQVIFITSLPFTAAGSYVLVGLTSLITRGDFAVSGDYFYPFLGLTLGGSTAISCVSVLSNPYPPPPSNSVVQGESLRQALVLRVPLVRLEF